MNKKTIIILSGIVIVFCCCLITVITAIVVINNNNNNPIKDPKVTNTVTPTPNPRNIIDNFNDNRNEWTLGEIVGSSSISDAYIKNGKFYLEYKSTADNGSILYDTFQKYDNYLDFELSIKGKLQEGSTNTTDYGLIFRRQDRDNYYVFFINEYYSEYLISAKVDGEFVDFTDWVETEYISDTNSNEIKVVADGSTFKFYINNQLVHTQEDTSITEAGEVGYMLQQYAKDDTALIEFDDFSIIER